jgi:hypothetical protein
MMDHISILEKRGVADGAHHSQSVDYSKDGQTSIAENGSKGLHTAVSLLLIEASSLSKGDNAIQSTAPRGACRKAHR